MERGLQGAGAVVAGQHGAAEVAVEVGGDEGCHGFVEFEIPEGALGIEGGVVASVEDDGGWEVAGIETASVVVEGVESYLEVVGVDVAIALRGVSGAEEAGGDNLLADDAVVDVVGAADAVGGDVDGDGVVGGDDAAAELVLRVGAGGGGIVGLAALEGDVERSVGGSAAEKVGSGVYLHLGVVFGGDDFDAGAERAYVIGTIWAGDILWSWDKEMGAQGIVALEGVVVARGEDAGDGGGGGGVDTGSAVAGVATHIYAGAC